MKKMKKTKAFSKGQKGMKGDVHQKGGVGKKFGAKQ